MRLLFKKGKQRELIKKLKEKRNLTFKQLAEKLGIREGKLKAYYDETSLLPELIYFKLDKEKLYNKLIIEKKEDNWGRSLGGLNSKGNTKRIIFPDYSKRLAEFYGIMLGDGNLTKIKGHKIGTYMIRIVGDSRFDRDYLLYFVKPLIEELFKINAKIGKFKKQNAMFVQAHSIELINFLERLEFKAGNKIENKLGIPLWIKKNNDYLGACIRGLFDTDGSVYKLTNQNCYQINFSNKNNRLLKEVRNSLILLGINVSKISKGKELYITKKDEIRKFLKLIGFHNLKHLKKVKMWKIAP